MELYTCLTKTFICTLAPVIQAMGDGELHGGYAATLDSRATPENDGKAVSRSEIRNVNDGKQVSSHSRFWQTMHHVSSARSQP